MNNAIAGLKLNNVTKGERGFRVVSNDANACPTHFGLFPVKADADAHAAELNAHPRQRVRLQGRCLPR
jgi:hypothetical protein